MKRHTLLLVAGLEKARRRKTYASKISIVYGLFQYNQKSALKVLRTRNAEERFSAALTVGVFEEIVDLSDGVSYFSE